MASIRGDLRALAVALLKAGSTAAGNRVFPSRVFPIWKLDYPVICVYTPTESNTITGQFPTHSDRVTRLSVQCIDANVDEDVESRLDALSDEVEAILDNDDNWGSADLCRVVFAGIDSEISFERDSERNYAAVTLNFDAHYITVVEPVSAPQTLIVEINGEEIEKP